MYVCTASAASESLYSNCICMSLFIWLYTYMCMCLYVGIISVARDSPRATSPTNRIFRRILQSEILSHPTRKTHCRMNEISRKFAISVKKGLGGEGP